MSIKLFMHYRKFSKNDYNISHLQLNNCFSTNIQRTYPQSPITFTNKKDAPLFSAKKNRCMFVFPFIEKDVLFDEYSSNAPLPKYCIELSHSHGNLVLY